MTDCGGEFCVPDSHVCDYPPEGSYAFLQDLLEEWRVASEMSMDAQSTLQQGNPELAEALAHEDAAREAWASQYRVIYGDDPDWSAIRDGCG